jgi:hypothetical protein
MRMGAFFLSRTLTHCHRQNPAVGQVELAEEPASKYLPDIH